ncbi:acetyl-CoA synthetase-like protein [Lepidopterella palustris CBS 459.81]|uniref:Acetyl-CoA synthetase-like protein n=1 Tax=Lepidopterella palustris CBS 459.81 TaxID=1314670 RepID=A0A8E2E6C5_9PEZI|nr:acetyl-CoA synthetase-like protein [Lepidopterella palustris CBS 459.81]
MAVTEAQQETIFTIDDLVRHRAQDDSPAPLVAFPRSKHDASEWEVFTGRHIDRFTDGAAKYMRESGLEQVTKEAVVAVLGQSDLDFAITTFALMRLGYSPCILSPRLSANAIAKLLELSKARILVFIPHFQGIANELETTRGVKLVALPQRHVYDLPVSDLGEVIPKPSTPSDSGRVAVFTHSAGSTGVPRIVPFTHGRMLNLALNAYKMRVLCTMPFFHGVGYMTLIQAIHSRHVAYFFDGNVPQTHETLTTAFRVVKPDAVMTVPYALKLLAEQKDGVELLRQPRMVSCAGSRIPDEIGDLLVEKGVYLVTAFGMSEAGFLFSSMGRARDDKDWAYLRSPPHIAPYVHMKPVGPGIYECVVLDGYIGKAVTNSDDPPNSYHTKDLFEAHPTKANSWKYVGRIDDRVTLINGEKILPLDMEGRIRKEAQVKDAVVFGVDKPVPGLLVFRANSASGLSDEEFIDKIWPAVEDANSRAEGFAQISREMIVLLPPSVDVPMTDKASIRRAQIYKDFAPIIEQTYSRMEDNNKGDLELTIPETEQWIISTFNNRLNMSIDGPESDFYASGVDSLRAIQMRGLIIKNLKLGGNASKCSSMMVLESGNASKLARRLHSIRTNGNVIIENELEIMENMIVKFSAFKPDPKGATIILTGATGSLGAHILHQLLTYPSITQIYCLIRAGSSSEASERLASSLTSRSLPLNPTSLPKITALPADLTLPTLGLPSHVLSTLRHTLTHIVHCAWPVNFTLPLSSFSPQITSLQNLLSLSLTAQAHFLFASSIGVATRSPPSSTPVPEAPIPDLNHSSPTGYARAKLVCERIVQVAVANHGARATILRIGQIVPSQTVGTRLWNPAEAIPLMVRAGWVMGKLPMDPPDMGICSWVALDVLAASICEIAGFGRGTVDGRGGEEQLVYNLTHPKPFSWTAFLARLRAAGMEFETVPWNVFLALLANSGEQDPEKNPAVKLVGFWTGQNAGAEGRNGVGKWESAAEGDEGERAERLGLAFETSAAQKASPSLRNAGPVLEGDWVRQVVEAWREGCWTNQKKELTSTEVV